MQNVIHSCWREQRTFFCRPIKRLLTINNSFNKTSRNILKCDILTLAPFWYKKVCIKSEVNCLRHVHISIQLKLFKWFKWWVKIVTLQITYYMFFQEILRYVKQCLYITVPMFITQKCRLRRNTWNNKI